MRKFNLLLSLLTLISFFGQAQPYQKTDFGVKARINSTEVEIQFFGTSTVRVLKSPEDKSFTKESLH